MQEQFINDNENTFMEGAGVYLKSTFSVIQGTICLTSKRFTFCKRSGIFDAVAGPLLMHLKKGNEMVFEIELDKIKSIHSEKHGFGSKFIFTNDKNEEFPLQFISGKEKWLQSIIDAVKNYNPNIKISQIGDNISFSTAEAVQSNTNNKSSDEALAELKRAKDKFDLGLITQAEYEIIKEQLRKLIN
jgi:hypothetical protein